MVESKLVISSSIKNAPLNEDIVTNLKKEKNKSIDDLTASTSIIEMHVEALSSPPIGVEPLKRVSPSVSEIVIKIFQLSGKGLRTKELKEDEIISMEFVLPKSPNEVELSHKILLLTPKKKTHGGFGNIKENLQMLGFSATPSAKSNLWFAKDEKEDKGWEQVLIKNNKKKKVDVGNNNKMGRPTNQDYRQEDVDREVAIGKQSTLDGIPENKKKKT